MSDENVALAKKVKAVIDKAETPHEVTVQEIAAELDVSVEDVTGVIDTHVVGDDGKITHAGVGRGGGWATPPEEPSEAA